MHTDTDPTKTNRRSENTKSQEDELFAHIAKAFEADAMTVERIKVRARAGARPERARPSLYRGWAFRMAVATALTLMIAVGVARFPSTENPLPTHSGESGGELHEELADEVVPERTEPTLVISNESGYLTVRAGGSQWLVLPGDAS